MRWFVSYYEFGQVKGKTKTSRWCQVKVERKYIYFWPCLTYSFFISQVNHKVCMSCMYSDPVVSIVYTLTCKKCESSGNGRSNKWNKGMGRFVHKLNYVSTQKMSLPFSRFSILVKWTLLHAKINMENVRFSSSWEGDVISSCNEGCWLGKSFRERIISLTLTWERKKNWENCQFSDFWLG